MQRASCELEVHHGDALGVASSDCVVGEVLRKQSINSQRQSTHNILYAHTTPTLSTMEGRWLSWPGQLSHLYSSWLVAAQDRERESGCCHNVMLL